jgi:hypothetical protein
VRERPRRVPGGGYDQALDAVLPGVLEHDRCFEFLERARLEQCSLLGPVPVEGNVKLLEAEVLCETLRLIYERTRLGELRTMDRKPVEPPDAVGLVFREPEVVIIRYKERVLAVFAEGAKGVLESFAAFSAFDRKMAHDYTLNQKLTN